MITKGERISQNPFEQDLAEQRQYESLAQGSLTPNTTGAMHRRPLSIGDRPPEYDDPNYIPSPTSHSRSNTMIPMVINQQPTGSVASAATGTWSTTSASAVTTVSAPMYLMSPEVETEWTQTLHELERNMSSLQAARSRAAQPKLIDAEETVREVRVLEDMVLGNMRRLALIHPDPRVQAEWHARAESFQRTTSLFRPTDTSSSSQVDTSEVDSYKESYSDPGRLDNEDFIIDRERHRRGEGSSKISSRAKQMFDGVDQDKGLSYIKKGTAGIFLLPIAVSGAILYGSAALLYGAGKGAFHLGKKAAAANSSRTGKAAQCTSSDARLRSISDPELASPTRAKFATGSKLRKHYEY